MSERGLTPLEVRRVAGTDEERRSLDPPTPSDPLLLL
jgi:hypothetical protein